MHHPQTQYTDSVAKQTIAIAGGVMAERAAASSKFQAVRKFSSCLKILSKNAKFGAEKPPLLSVQCYA